MTKLLTYDEVRNGYVGNIEMRLGGVSKTNLKQMITMSKEDYDMFRSKSFPLPANTFL